MVVNTVVRVFTVLVPSGFVCCLVCCLVCVVQCSFLMIGLSCILSQNRVCQVWGRDVCVFKFTQCQMKGTITLLT